MPGLGNSVAAGGIDNAAAAVWGGVGVQDLTMEARRPKGRPYAKRYR